MIINIHILVTGEENNLSLELIQHLAHRGARKFVLVSKTVKKTISGFKTLVLGRLKNKNVTVIESIADLSTARGAENILREAITLGPIGGIFYISTVSVFKHFYIIYRHESLQVIFFRLNIGSSNWSLIVVKRK